ncbi:hypothetical protein BGZ93_008767 [Podila epicladia]|nr:hypothetical protein BGZ93_008767 [Podila epicladia]
MEKLLDLSSFRYKAPPNNNQDARESDSKGENDIDINNNNPKDTKVKHRPRGPYQEYSDKQWNDAVFDLTDNFGSMNPRGGGAGRTALLQEEHNKFILEFFGGEPVKNMNILQDAIKGEVWIGGVRVNSLSAC